MKSESTPTNVPARSEAAASASVAPSLATAVWASENAARRQGNPDSRSQQDTPSEAALAASQAGTTFGAKAMDALQGSSDLPVNPGLAVNSASALRDEILSRVLEFRNQSPSSMTVILRPDPGTELSIQLRSTDGRIDVHVRLERGEAGAYAGSWGSLQQSLSQHGVNLLGLETAPLPTLPRAQAVTEPRVDASGSVAGTGLVDHRMVTASAMSFSSNDPQRDPSSKSGSGQETPQGQGGSAAFEARSGSAGSGQGQRGPFQNRADEPGGLPGGRSSDTKSTARFNPDSTSATSDAPGAPWESWA